MYHPIKVIENAALGMPSSDEDITKALKEVCDTGHCGACPVSKRLCTKDQRFVRSVGHCQHEGDGVAMLAVIRNGKT